MSEQVHTPYLGPNHRAVKGRLWTIGHSTRSIEEFVGLLKSHGVSRILDVRLLPGSRRYPHFNAEALAASLEQAGIDYRHLRDLGGRRKAGVDSENLGWKNASFRGYADYMATEAFRRALDQAMALAGAAKPHRLTAFAKVEGEKVSYPAEEPVQKSLSFEKLPD